MSLAQEEAEKLLGQKETISSHPEDQHYDSSPSDQDVDDDYDNDNDNSNEKRSNRIGSSAAAANTTDSTHPHDYSDDDSDIDYSDIMLAKPTSYHVPTTIFDANTGPKGVIADAQSYERAKKRSFRRTLMSVSGFDFHSKSAPDHPVGNSIPRKSSPGAQSGEESEEDVGFMQKWRESRMRELQKKSPRRPSPSKRRYGTFEAVNADGYLDAIEKVTSSTIVVVCIYNPDLSESSIVEDCLATIARKQLTTRFIKLHHEIAEMDHIQAPALIAYKNGDVFATLVDIFDQIPDGRDLSAASLEDLLMQHRII
ncbi:hypothetical protein FQN57_007503 [Myotisia sp. PD_48]|nr:hypothetical protein FQN57_007503 [Myotisia sp. PD_48]